MIQKSYTAWLVPFALTLSGFGSTTSALAQTTTLPFEATYNTRTTLRPITPDVFEGTDVGESADAPYGLTNFTGLSYSRIDPETGAFIVDTNPATFGLEDSPIGLFELRGSGSERLFGTGSGTVLFDLEAGLVTGSSTINITDGAGQFRDAEGVLRLSFSNPINADPTEPGEVFISGSFQIPQPVPEPRTSATLIGTIALGVLFLLRQRLH